MTDTKTKIIKNSFSIYAAKGLNLFITFFVFIAIANYLGDVAFGRFTIAITYIATFDIIANFGINQVVVRELAAARHNRRQVIGSGLLLKACVTSLAFITSILISVFSNYSQDTKIAIGIIAFNLLISSKLSSTRTIFETLFQADLRMFYPMLFTILDNVLFAALFYFLIYFTHPSMITIALIYTATNLPGCLLMLFKFFKSTVPDFSDAIKMIKIMLRESLPIAAYLFFSILTTKIDILMLSRMVSEGEVGVFSAAIRLVYPLMFFSTSFTLSIFPLLSKYHSSDHDKFMQIFYTGTKIIFLLAVLLSIPLAVNAESLIKTLYIEQYVNAIAPFRILVLALGLNFFNFYFVDFFISMNRQKTMTWILAISLGINVLLNIILIPRFSFLGSSYARLLTAGSIFLMFLFVMFTKLKIKKIIEYRLLLLLFAFIAVQYLIYRVPWIFNLMISSVVFVLFLFLFKIVSKDEVSFLFSLRRLNSANRLDS